MTTIINQYGMELQGEEFDIIFDAYKKGITTVVFTHKKVKILDAVETKNQKLIIKVEVE